MTQTEIGFIKIMVPSIFIVKNRNMWSLIVEFGYLIANSCV